jgi:hypothetical protein
MAPIDGTPIAKLSGHLRASCPCDAETTGRMLVLRTAAIAGDALHPEGEIRKKIPPHPLDTLAHLY